jgi:hypothetical protein
VGEIQFFWACKRSPLTLFAAFSHQTSQSRRFQNFFKEISENSNDLGESIRLLLALMKRAILPALN